MEYNKLRIVRKFGYLECIMLRWGTLVVSGNDEITDWMYGLLGSSSSIPVNVKTVQMLFNDVWRFLPTVWTTVVRFCAELIDHSYIHTYS
jgi:hypothetical protein